MISGYLLPLTICLGNGQYPSTAHRLENRRALYLTTSNNKLRLPPPKTDIMKRTIILLLLTLVGCYNSTDKSHIMPTLDDPTTTIAALRKNVGVRGAAITEDIVLRGRVTSSDAEDNIYRSIFVEDDTAAVEVLLGLSSLEAHYPEGLEVALHIKGCRLDYLRGVLQVGTEAIGGGANTVDYINSREGADRVVRRGSDVTPREAMQVDITDLSEDMCGRLVRIDGVMAVHSTSIDTLEGQTMADALWRGSALFKTADGDSIAVYTSNYARYADAPLPLSEVSLTGILEWGAYGRSSAKCYHITMRYEDDCDIM